MLGLSQRYIPKSSSAALDRTAQSDVIAHTAYYHQMDSSQTNSNNVITIPAKTATPIVSSVPKCRKPKASRSHPIDTVHGSAIRENFNYHQLEYQQSAGMLSRKMPITSRADMSDNQVLLIVQDVDQANGTGVPIVARRLASKSINLDELLPVEELNHRHGKQSRGLVIPASQEPSTILVERPARVIGRRTHRMIQQQQQQHPRVSIGKPALDLKTQPLSMFEATPFFLDERHISNTNEYLLEGRRHRSHQSHSKTNRYKQNGSVPNIPDRSGNLLHEYSLEPMVERRQKYLLDPSSYTSAPAPPIHPSVLQTASSCSSLCSSNAPTVDCLECCATAIQSPPPTGYLMPPPQSAYTRGDNHRANCCSLGKGYHIRNDQPELPCARILPSYQFPMQRPPIPSPCQSSSRANRNGKKMTIPEGQIDKRQLFRSSSASRYRNLEQEEQEVAAVSQMYESLAAELKAKLGNPKMRPILLPPKDYDTMSRKQGKLTGIELRRSTNPQLVGPSANRKLLQTNNNDNNGNNNTNQNNDHKSNNKSNANYNSPAISPRSRSNSSSGIGSISTSGCGANSQSSPTASKSSSSEDMRSSSTELDSRNTSGSSLKHNQEPSDVENGSPDNCSSSDSGHCGSARLNSCNTNTHEARLDVDSKLKASSSHRKSQFEAEDTSTQEGNSSAAGTSLRGRGVHLHNPSNVSEGVLWNGRVEVPLKVNSHKNNGNTYLATKQIIY